MRIILIALLLTGCKNFGGVKEITEDNAKKHCRNFGVSINVDDVVIPELTINVVGREVERFCGINTVACLINGNTIYTWDNDWLAIGHETCHAIDKYSKHLRYQKPFIRLEDRASAR